MVRSLMASHISIAKKIALSVQPKNNKHLGVLDCDPQKRRPEELQLII